MLSSLQELLSVTTPDVEQSSLGCECSPLLPPLETLPVVEYIIKLRDEGEGLARTVVLPLDSDGEREVRRLTLSVRLILLLGLQLRRRRRGLYFGFSRRGTATR